ncbi:MAG: two-component system chemotaxis response regulator CheY [Candidatus Latescibacterota bacterium]|jgi:two-component system chemotaxis response regulator CheY
MSTKFGQETLELPLVHDVIDWKTIEADVIEEWVLSTRDAIREIEGVTLKAESEGVSDDGLQRIRAHLHNMKGEAGFVGLGGVGDVCHRVETELESVVNRESFRADMLLDVVDWFGQLLSVVENGEAGARTLAADPSPKKPRVLIVEDGVINRKLLERMLHSVSDCDVAVDGEAGLEAFLKALDDQKPYDVIFLDIMMPKMDGQKMLEKVRAEENTRDLLGSDGVKVVMTTALKDSQNVLGAFRQGCEGYLVKPIDKDALFDKLRELNVFVA